MSRNYYGNINLHLVWHTKSSPFLLSPDVEIAIHHWLKQRMVETPQLFVHEIGGTETHVHRAATIPPTVVAGSKIDWSASPSASTSLWLGLEPHQREGP